MCVCVCVCVGDSWWFCCRCTFLSYYYASLLSYGQLSFIETAGVQWTGTIPSQIGLLSNSLELISIDGANFQNNDDSSTTTTATIPTELYSLTKLRSLTISNSRVGGTISRYIGQLTSLERLDLSGNLFHGVVVPSEIGLLTNLRHFEFTK